MLQICPNAATVPVPQVHKPPFPHGPLHSTLQSPAFPLTCPASSDGCARGTEGWGSQRVGVQWSFPSLALTPGRQLRYSGPCLLYLPTLTLSRSDPLSRWASSGQQRQQQHIPARALPSNKQPWHCLALLSPRWPVPAPGLRLLRMEGYRACLPGIE